MLFGICIVDNDAQSYQSQTPLVLLNMIKRKSTHRLVDQRATFTSLCVPVDGIVRHEATVFLQRITDLLSAKWEMDYGLVMGWIHTRLSFANLHTTLLCIQGCHNKWCTLGLVDGACIAL